MKITDENEEGMREEEEARKAEEEQKDQPLSTRVIKILTFYLVIGFLAWNLFNFIFSSNFCSIKEIIIQGNNYLSEEEILFRSGINLGENIFKLDLKKSINSLKQEPRIKEVEIKRVIPNKIIICLTEREAAVSVRLGEEYFLCAKEGIVLSKTSESGEALTLPLISGLEIDKIDIGEIIDKPEFRTALESINLTEVILPKKFCRVEILSPDDFMICDKDETLKLRVNTAEVIISKENLIREALEKIEREKLLIEYIDIRFKDSLLIKLKK
ncbi:MAG TPA: FtsQ-type POTRA domain-containing protein [Candidatus Atribacteria bacterium]|nr:FtsQ-type POTRA domain-containing protein [Candidatus Atribacteria bacterium]